MKKHFISRSKLKTLIYSLANFFSLILLSSIFACGQTNKQARATDAGWKKYEATNYSIQYPREWELDVSGAMGALLILLSPVESDKDQFRENVNLIVQDLSGHDINLDKFAEISEGQIKTLITNSELIESKKMKNNSQEYHKIIYSGDQGVYHLKYEQYYWVKNNNAYILTLTCEINKFTDYLKTGEQILNSFMFK